MGEGPSDIDCQKIDLGNVVTQVSRDLSLDLVSMRSGGVLCPQPSRFQWSTHSITNLPIPP